MGVDLVCGHVRNICGGDCCGVLQARHKVRLPMRSLHVLLRIKEFCSIQSWALVEAKKRMEARGEATDYVPKP